MNTNLLEEFWQKGDANYNSQSAHGKSHMQFGKKGTEGEKCAVIDGLAVGPEAYELLVSE